VLTRVLAVTVLRDDEGRSSPARVLAPSPQEDLSQAGTAISVMATPGGGCR